MSTLSQDEQQLLDMINTLRTNPSSFILPIQNRQSSINNNLLYCPDSNLQLQMYDVNSLINSVAFLKTQTELQPLQHNTLLSEICKQHTDSLNSNSRLDNNIENINEKGTYSGQIAYLMDSYYKSAQEIVLNWVIDDGMDQKTNRLNLLYSKYKQIGISINKHPSTNYVCCIILAEQYGPPVVLNYQSLQQQIMQSINQIRKEPKSIIPYLEEQLKLYDEGNIYNQQQYQIFTQEGRKAVEECIEYMSKQEPLPELKPLDQLNKAAKDHCYQLSRGSQSIQGSNAGIVQHGGVEERVGKYLEWFEWIGQNICVGPFLDCQQVIYDWLVDDGRKQRGHRHNLMGKEFQYFGVAVSEHPVHQQIVVANFITDYQLDNTLFDGSNRKPDTKQHQQQAQQQQAQEYGRDENMNALSQLTFRQQ